MSPAGEQDPNRSGADRILDAAVLLFGEHGFRGTTMKDIASQAGVSQALIVHHYGSKDALRTTCDEHVSRLIRTRKEEGIGAGPQFDPYIGLAQLKDSRPLMRYLIRTLTERGAHASQLIDEMISDAQDYVAQGEQAGLIKPSAVPRDRVVVLVLWSLGALVLHEQAHRLLGVDFLAGDGSPESMQRYFYPALELYSQGLVEEGALDELTAVLKDSVAEPETDDHDPEQ